MLCDGNFLHALASMNLGDPKALLAKYLGSPPKLFTTRCVQHELRRMGRECKDASFAARALECVRGGPDPPNASALDSILAAVEDANAERFLVCTQDESLRRALSSDHPAVPVVFAHTSGLQMEPPSDADATGVASRKESGVGLRDDEREKLGQEESARDVTRVRTNVRYAKPKAKGPNPLSAKKKRKKVDDGSTRKEKPAPGAAEGGVKKKRKRRGEAGARKRSEADSNRGGSCEYSRESILSEGRVVYLSLLTRDGRSASNADVRPRRPRDTLILSILPRRGVSTPSVLPSGSC